MRRLIFVLLVCGCASTEAPAEEPPPAPPAPAPNAEEPPVAEPSSPELLTEIEAEILSCDGAALTRRGSEAIGRLDLSDAPDSVSLMSRWERGRIFAADGTLDPKSFTVLLPMLQTKLGQPPPTWWVDTLKSGRGGSDVATFYDTGMKPHGGDRSGSYETGPGGTRVRPGGLPLLESDGKLAVDLSVARVVLGPLPKDPGTAIEVTRKRAGSTLFVATYQPGSGGFRFPLRAVDSNSAEVWSTEVCAADRKVLGGVGHLIVEMVVLDEPTPSSPRRMSPSSATKLAVFTAETHGVGVEVFDMKTGERTLAWASDLWSWRGHSGQ